MRVPTFAGARGVLAHLLASVTLQRQCVSRSYLFDGGRGAGHRAMRHMALPSVPRARSRVRSRAQMDAFSIFARRQHTSHTVEEPNKLIPVHDPSMLQGSGHVEKHMDLELQPASSGESVTTQGTTENIWTAGKVLKAFEGQIQRGDLDGAALLLEAMWQRGMEVNEIHLSGMVRVAAAAKLLPHSLKWLDYTLKQGFVPTLSAYEDVFDLMADEGKFSSISDTLGSKERIPQPSEEIFIAGISALGSSQKVELIQTGLRICLDALKSKKLTPTERVFAPLVQALVVSGKVGEVPQLYATMQKDYGIVPGEDCHTSIVVGYYRAKKIDKAVRALEMMKKGGIPPTAKAYGAIISGYAKFGPFKEAERWLKRMEEDGHPANMVALSVLAAESAKRRNFHGARAYYDRIMKAGLKPDIVCLNSMVESCCTTDHVILAIALLKAIEKSGVITNNRFYNSIIRACCKRGSVDVAQQFYNSMVAKRIRPDSRTFSPMIYYFVDRGRMDAAEKVFVDMMLSGIRPSMRVFQYLFTGYSKEGDLDKMDKLLQTMQEYELEPDMKMYTTFIQTFADLRDQDGAVKILDDLIVSKAQIPDDMLVLLIIMCSRTEATRILDRVWEYMKAEGREFTGPAYLGAIVCYAISGEMKKAEALTAEARALGFALSLDAYNAFLKGYSRYEDLPALLRTLKTMREEGIKVNTGAMCQLAANNYAFVSQSTEPLESVYTLLRRVLNRFSKAEVALTLSFFEHALRWCLEMNALPVAAHLLSVMHQDYRLVPTRATLRLMAVQAEKAGDQTLAKLLNLYLDNSAPSKVNEPEPDDASEVGK